MVSKIKGIKPRGSPAAPSPQEPECDYGAEVEVRKIIFPGPRCMSASGLSYFVWALQVHLLFFEGTAEQKKTN